MFSAKTVAPGIAIGPAIVWAPAAITVVHQAIRPHQVAIERQHLDAALKSAQFELHEIEARVLTSVGQSASGIFTASLRMLEDPHLRSEIIKAIESRHVNAATAVQTVVDEYARKMAAAQSEYLAARAEDILDMGRRLQRHLRRQESPRVPEMPEPRVLIVETLAATELIALDRAKLLAIVMTQSAPTSHAALLASTLGIPVVARAPDLWGRVESGDTVVVDGNAGGVLVRPTELALRQYRTRRELFEHFSGEVAGLREHPATTLDGRTIRLTANVSLAEEIPYALAQGADGIGLVRTEFYYLSHAEAPSEAEQFEFYTGLVRSMAPRPVTFRTFDLGGDKAGANHEPEANPMLGCRGIRLLFEQPELFETQLRALLRASAFGTVRIMFPLITSLTEFQDTMRIVNRVKEDLSRQAISFDPGVQFGCMIETPAAAAIPDLLAHEVEFFSIGSNDLIQYTLATDRLNSRVSYIYEPLHLAILRMMRGIIRAGHRRQRHVSLCGEMAADPIYTIILLGLGVDELSMNPVMIPAIKQIVRGVEWTQARQIARGVLRASRAKDVQAYLEHVMVSRFPRMMSIYSHADEQSRDKIDASCEPVTAEKEETNSP
ncbi:MAG TPA: phosphoenolpyruvate--protein phosphotransferase [Pirellulales bacterium]|jgi:phosphotransferase system enzyme I (PtsI)|nr:phosphoenolpyruvate--protein phosphotransferase [Pirellulales bacterium]